MSGLVEALSMGALLLGALVAFVAARPRGHSPAAVRAESPPSSPPEIRPTEFAILYDEGEGGAYRSMTVVAALQLAQKGAVCLYPRPPFGSLRDPDFRVEVLRPAEQGDSPFEADMLGELREQGTLTKARHRLEWGLHALDSIRQALVAKGLLEDFTSRSRLLNRVGFAAILGALFLLITAAHFRIQPTLAPLISALFGLAMGLFGAATKRWRATPLGIRMKNQLAQELEQGHIPESAAAAQDGSRNTLAGLLPWWLVAPPRAARAIHDRMVAMAEPLPDWIRWPDSDQAQEPLALEAVLGLLDQVRRGGGLNAPGAGGGPGPGDGGGGGGAGGGAG